MEEIKQLTEKLGKYEDWTLDTLNTIIQDEILKQLLTQDVAAYLVDNYENDEIKDVLLPIKYDKQLGDAEALLGEKFEQLEEGKITVEELLVIVESIKDKGVLSDLTYTLIKLTLSKEGEDLELDETFARNTLTKVLDVIDEVGLEHGLQVAMNIVQLVLPTRELYFQKFGIDIIDDEPRLHAIIDSVNEKQQAAYDAWLAMQEQAQKMIDEFEDSDEEDLE